MQAEQPIKTFEVSTSPHQKHYRGFVLLFFAALFLLTSGGRINSGDAGTQLQAAMLLANTGHLGTSVPPGVKGNSDTGLWVKSPDGLYYQCHDIGNVCLMFPAAWLSSCLSHASPKQKILNPPILARLGVAWTYALFSALGAFFVFRLFALVYSVRTAFLLSLLFSTGTIFWAYTKSAWDVTEPVSVSRCCATLRTSYCCTPRNPLRWKPAPLADVVWLIVSLLIAGAFRYSLLPFLMLATGAVFWAIRSFLPLKHYMTGMMLFTLGIIPSLIYNFVRMGNFMRPATTAPQFAGTSDLKGNFIEGFLGLLCSPNRGLLEFAPIFLLLFALPWVWRQLTNPTKQFTTIYGLASLLYICVIAKVRNWGAFGWGPRYLLPLMPILLFIVGTIIVARWAQWKHWLRPLIALSIILNFAPVLINWHLATTEYPLASGPGSLTTTLPRQQMAVWHGLVLAMQRKPLPAPPQIMTDPIRSGGARFPDLWTFRLMEHSHSGLLAGLIITAILVFLIGYSLRYLLRPQEEIVAIRR